MQQFMGVDIGGTNTRLIIMDDQRRFRHYKKVATASWAALADPLSGLKTLLAEHLQGQDVELIMLGLPGILSRDRQTVLSLPFIPTLDGEPVAAKLSAALGKAVLMDKDVNHLMWWDLNQLDALPQVAAGLYLGTGMGNSLWLNGVFYHGAHGAAGELGHIPWPQHRGLCRCGNIGCIETLASGHWLTQWAQDVCPETPFAELFVQHGDHPDLTAFIDRLAMTVATEMNILDPECLILGGGVLTMRQFPQERLIAGLRRHLRSPYPAQGLGIIFSDVNDETGCRGACLAAQHNVMSSDRRQAC